MKIKVKKCVGVSYVGLNLENKKRIKKIKVKKCMGVEESRERKKERRQKLGEGLALVAGEKWKEKEKKRKGKWVGLDVGACQ